MMRFLFFALGLGFLSFSPQPRATADQSALVGSWKMVSYQRVVDNGTPQNGLGEHPKGIVIFTPEGRVVL
ncbi:MAG TPA: lipocalin-like domain-containing protein, partial [Candidatus Acidoferrales bacterium]|nr:lipocalin-like domain-containing protein [Candidatus Acidoferrales bacterium]